MGNRANRPPSDTILIVTGSCLRAEELDRPLAYFLQQRIVGDPGRELPPKSVVISDYRYLCHHELHGYSVISVGGPAVNAVTQKWLDCVPVTHSIEGVFFLQSTPSGTFPRRACIWGIDHKTTVQAIHAFADDYLDGFLDSQSPPWET